MSGNKVFPHFKILILPPPDVHFHRPFSWSQWNPKIDIWITLVSRFGDCAGVNAKHWRICCELPTSCFNVSSHEIVADGTCRACCYCNVRQLITPMWRTDKCENSPNHGGKKAGGWRSPYIRAPPATWRNLCSCICSTIITSPPQPSCIW